jgi:arylsulfatase A-like enzyme
MADKPNILIIWGDDIGWFNISAYNHGARVRLPTHKTGMSVIGGL